MPKPPPEASPTIDVRLESTPPRIVGMTIAEFLTAVIGLGSLAVAGMTYMVARDTSDLKHAVTQLTAIAKQATRQADAANTQLAILRDQVAETKKQTPAIREGAEAQKRAAEAAAIAGRPEFAFAGVRGDSTGGDGASGLTRFYVDLTNVGGGYLRLGSARISTSIGATLAIVPRFTGKALDGSGIAVAPKNSQGYERDAAARDASSAHHTASLAGLVANPEEMNRASLAADADAREAIRLREMARVLRSALPAAEARERKAGMTADRARIERDGVRRAGSWEKRYASAAAELVAVLAEMRADARAVEEFNREAASAGLGTLWPAEYTLRRSERGGSFASLADEAAIPSFAAGAHKLWPPQ